MKTSELWKVYKFSSAVFFLILKKYYLPNTSAKYSWINIVDMHLR